MKFTADEEQTVLGGKYNYQANVGTGAVTLQIKINPASSFLNVTDGAFTVDDTGIIEITTCRMKAGLTNDAEFIMSKI